ncbi:MAG: ABC transporter permease [Salinigranum sp.]
MSRNQTIRITDRIDDFFAESRYLSKGRTINVLSILVGILVWQVASQSLGAVILAPPSAVIAKTYELVISMELVSAAIGSFQTLLLGYVISIVVAVPLGFALGQSKYVLWALNPYIDAVYTSPPIVYLPLVVVWFGLGLGGRVFFVFMFCFFEILINTYQGITVTNEKYLDVGRAFGASWWTTQRKIVLPAALPFIFTGLRLGIGRAVRGVIVAELFLRLVNLGRLMSNAGMVLNTSVQLSVIITIALMGVVLQRVVLYAAHRSAPWYYASGAQG